MNKRILRLAIPNIISSISVPLLGSVDTALVGHLEAVYYVGAIAIGSMIFNFIYWGFGFLRTGTTGLTAQAFGEKNDAESILILTRALIVALGGGLLLIILQTGIAYIAFSLVDATDAVETHARIYFDIRIWAAPATLCLYAFQGWFLGRQNATYAMILMIVVNVCNIVLDLVFIKVLGMKTDGVALATVFSSYVGLVLALWLFHRSYRLLLVQMQRNLILQTSALKRFFTVNRDIMIRTLLLVFSYSFFTAKSAELGDMVVAANAILMQFWMIMAYGVDGFSVAAESLVGRYVGARDGPNLKKAVRYSFYWGLGLGTAFALVYLIFDRSLLSIFTDKPDLIELALVFYPWIVVAPIINTFCFLWDGIFVGATATRAMVISMLFSTGGGFLLTYYLTIGQFGNHALWLAMTLFMLVRGITLSIYAKREIFSRVETASTPN